MTTRRKWLGTTLLASGAAAAGAVELFRFRRSGETLLGTLPFEGEGQSPLDTPLGEELDGRQFTDLTHLERDHSVTPAAQFYIRTRASHLLDTAKPWSVRLGSAVISLDDLKAQSQPQGLHLMECAGNVRSANFGLISVAQWDGVPLSALLQQAKFDRRSRVLVSGFDAYSTKPVTPSIPGASWSFSRQEIEDAGAFLAIAMNGQPLTPDHGAPVRLVLPGWYGCACIKWVNEISAAGDAAAATSQMREYAARTHQRGMPERASEYQPSTIDPAAMPVRVEKWRVNGKLQYRVAGIVWGGSQPAERLLIRFGPDEPYVPVSHVDPSGSSWGLWSQVWTPNRPGTYRIRLVLADPSVRTRRLDAGYYVRQVRVDEV